MNRVPIQPRLLEWAIARASISPEDIRIRFTKYDAWIEGSLYPTLKQLQNFARVTHTAIGCFFLNEPPELPIPIPDFRTVKTRNLEKPSPDLLDTIYLCQQRQDWYIRYARSVGAEALSYIGTATTNSNIEHVAAIIRSMLQMDVTQTKTCHSWEDALRHIIQLAEEIGVLVMVSGVVGSNNTRKLNPKEFRGFALSHAVAPLIFINGSDTKSAQMFTLAHELAHLWLGQSALSDATAATSATSTVERWCDRVAAEVLVPLEAFRAEYNTSSAVVNEMQRLARVFKVSTLVVLRRMNDVRGFDRSWFWPVYQAEEQRLMGIVANRSGGGDYYNTTTARISRRFTRAIVTSTLEGRSTFTEAFRLVGCRRMSTFAELGNRVGVTL